MCTNIHGGERLRVNTEFSFGGGWGGRGEGIAVKEGIESRKRVSRVIV